MAAQNESEISEIAEEEPAKTEEDEAMDSNQPSFGAFTNDSLMKSAGGNYLGWRRDSEDEEEEKHEQKQESSAAGKVFSHYLYLKKEESEGEEEVPELLRTPRLGDAEEEENLEERRRESRGKAVPGSGYFSSRGEGSFKPLLTETPFKCSEADLSNLYRPREECVYVFSGYSQRKTPSLEILNV